MKCRVCSEELLKNNPRCIKCGFNNEPYINKEIGNVDNTEEEIIRENIIEKTKELLNKDQDKKLSSKLILISLAVFGYLYLCIAFGEGVFGIDYSEESGPTFNQGHLMLAIASPAIIAQFMCYFKYLNNKFKITFGARLAVKWGFLYTLFMIASFYCGAAIVWLIMFFFPIVIPFIISILRS